MTPALELVDVHKTFRVAGREITAVDGVSLSVEPGRTVGLIGESGSGKSTTSRLALRLAEVDSGRVVVDGVDLAALGAEELRRRRRDMTMVFQEPLDSLNPRRTVGSIVAEPLRIHFPALSRDEVRRRTRETFDLVSLDPALMTRLPGELSGGQQQRVGVARAVITRPGLIVLDEPTSALDLSVRAQILKLLIGLQAELGMAYLFVSHDMQTVEYIADEVHVMHRGRIVESGATADVFAEPRHPYTRRLLASVLPTDPRIRRAELPAESADESVAG